MQQLIGLLSDNTNWVQPLVRAMDAAGQMGFVHLSITTRRPAEQTSNGR